MCVILVREVLVRQMSRERAAEPGLETVAILQRDSYDAPSGRRVELRALIDAAVSGTVEYRPEHVFPPVQPGSFDTAITIENTTVLEVRG